jgi:hypothetical protein
LRREPAERGALSIEHDANHHHLYLTLVQASGGAALTGYRAFIASSDAFSRLKHGLKYCFERFAVACFVPGLQLQTF